MSKQPRSFARSLYWRIGFGFILFLAITLSLQVALFFWVAGETEGAASLSRGGGPVCAAASAGAGALVAAAGAQASDATARASARSGSSAVLHTWHSSVATRSTA